jgi:hypothetical protein
MDTKYTFIELTERLNYITIEINVALRPDKEILYSYFEEIPRLLQIMNSLEDNNLISKNVLKNLYHTYTNMLSEFDYAAIEKKREMLKIFVFFENCIIDFIQYNPSKKHPTIEIENQFVNALRVHQENYIISLEIFKILDSICQYTSKRDYISRELALSLFLLQKEYLWSSQYLQEPFNSWDVLKTKDKSFQKYLEISTYIDAAYDQNVAF